MLLISQRVFALSPAVRYVATYRHGELRLAQRPDLRGASSAESDRYEELLVNPALLTLVRQRGDIDCGGARYVLVRYGNFFQLVCPVFGGHVSVALDPSPDVLRVVDQIEGALRTAGLTIGPPSGGG
jgi:hypothetical protein